MSHANVLAHAIEQTADQLDNYANRNMRVPKWLDKKAEACKVMEKEPRRGLSMLIDGMQDEIDTMQEALNGR